MNSETTYIVIGLGSAGDVHPNVGLAQALLRRGHRVIFGASTVFRNLAEKVGLEFVAFGTEEDYYTAVRDPDLWHPTRSLKIVTDRLMLPCLAPVYEFIRSRAKEGPVVVTAPATALGARIAQEKLGVPLASIHLQPSLIRSVIRPPCIGFPNILGHLPKFLRSAFYYVVDRAVIDPRLAPGVNAFRASIGLPPTSRFFDRGFHSRQMVIGMFPEFFAQPQPDWPSNTHLAGFPLWDESDVRAPSHELEQFLSSGPAPVIFTAGSANAHAKDFFAVSAEVCKRKGWRGILLSQFPEQMPARLPDGVRQFQYVPFSEVLLRAAALVHHVGIGTTAQALAAGIPQLVMPLAHDQPDNAMRVQRLGVGDFILPANYKVDAVMKKFERLLQPETNSTCRKWASKIVRGEALQKACELVESLAGEKHGSSPNNLFSHSAYS
ncbi:MAG: glycosyltransferase [Acidobacteria bacterium]|nr:glycosyltransferase [Acidobacteriota bacterium]